MWNDAVAVVRSEFAAFPGQVLTELHVLAESIRREKNLISFLTSSKGSNEHCACCGGKCCETGKFHFTVIDLLVHLATGKELFRPVFQGSFCPYLGSEGCLMDPSYRPYICVTFLCERLEKLLSPEELEQVYNSELRLRNLYRRLEEYFGNRFMQGLLLNYQRYSRGEHLGIITAKNPRYPGPGSHNSIKTGAGRPHVDNN